MHVCYSGYFSIKKKGESIIKYIFLKGSMAQKAEFMWHYLTQSRKTHGGSLEQVDLLHSLDLLP